MTVAAAARGPRRRGSRTPTLRQLRLLAARRHGWCERSTPPRLQTALAPPLHATPPRLVGDHDGAARVACLFYLHGCGPSRCPCCG